MVKLKEASRQCHYFFKILICFFMFSWSIVPCMAYAQDENSIVDENVKHNTLKAIVEIIELNTPGFLIWQKFVNLTESMAKPGILGELYGLLSDIHSTASECYEKTSNFTVPVALPDSVKSNIEDFKSAHMVISVLREQTSEVAMMWLDNHKPSLEYEMQKKSKEIYTATQASFLYAALAMTAAGYNLEEVKIVVSKMGKIGQDHEEGSHFINYKAYKTVDKPSVKISFDVVIDLAGGRLPNKDEFLSLAHEILGDSNAAGQWVNFYLPQMDRKKGWFASVEIKSGTEKISFNPQNIPKQLRHLYKE